MQKRSAKAQCLDENTSTEGGNPPPTKRRKTPPKQGGKTPPKRWKTPPKRWETHGRTQTLYKQHHKRGNATPKPASQVCDRLKHRHRQPTKYNNRLKIKTKTQTPHGGEKLDNHSPGQDPPHPLHSPRNATTNLGLHPFPTKQTDPLLLHSQLNKPKPTAPPAPPIHLGLLNQNTPTHHPSSAENATTKPTLAVRPAQKHQIAAANRRKPNGRVNPSSTDPTDICTRRQETKRRQPPTGNPRTPDSPPRPPPIRTQTLETPPATAS